MSKATTRIETQDASIAELLDGGLVEMVNAEMAAIAANILDPNASATATRKLTLTLTMKPNKARDVVETQVAVSAKLAPMEPQSTTLFVSRGIHGASLSEVNHKQPNLFDGATVTHENGETIVTNVKLAKG